MTDVRQGRPVRSRRAAGRHALVWSIAWRFLRGTRSRLLDRTARAALVATSLGVMALVIAMALMTGYRQDLRRKLVRGNAAVMAYPLVSGGPEIPAAAMVELAALPGVREVRRVTYGQGALEASPGADRVHGEGVEVTLRGVDPGSGIVASRCHSADMPLTNIKTNSPSNLIIAISKYNTVM